MDDLSEKPQDGLTGEISFGPDDPQVQARSAYDVSPIIDQNLYKTASAALERNRDRPFTSAHEFVQHQLNKDEPQLPQYDREAVKAWQEGAKGLGHLAAYNIPVVGEGLALYDMANAVHDIASPEFREAINKGDYLTSGLDVANLALSALGVPWKAAKGAAQSVGKAILGAPGKAAAAGAAAAAGMTPEDAEASFFSKRAFMSPAIQKAMREAEAATLIHGRNPHEVFKEHGWTPDPSGHMVSELSDEGARIIPEGLEKFRAGNTNLSLGDVLSHPDLFDLYPSSYSTKLTPYLPRTNPEKERGYFNATGDQIGSNIRLSERDLLENLLHEHQHRIQRVEGMSPGQNSEDFQRAHQSIMIPLEEKLRSMQGAITLRSLMKQNPELSDPVSAIMFAKQHNIDIGPQPLPYVKKDIESLFDDMRDTQNKIVTARQTAPDPFQEYLRSLGEYTARLPGERLGMSAAERRNAYPFDPNYPVIVRAPARDLMHQVANPKWEAERDRAVELARELQKNPIPHKDKGGAVAKLLGKLMPPGSGYAAGGAIPRADDEAFFRRLALWTYSVAPLFSGRQALAERRRGYQEGGSPKDTGIVDKALNFLSQLNPVGTAEAGPYTNVLRSIAEKYRPHYDPDAMIKGMPKQKWISNVALSRPIEDMSVRTKAHREMLPDVRMQPVDVADEALISGFGDRTPAGYVVTHLNDEKLRRPVDMLGGPSFAQDKAAQLEHAYWGSNRSRASGLANKGIEAAEAGYTPTFMYVNQGPQSQDFSHMMTDMVLGQLNPSKMDPKLVEQFNHIMRNVEPQPGLAPLASFPGIESPTLRRWLMNASEGGAGRAKMAKVMDKTMFLRDPGFADIGAARFATTKPELMNTPIFSAGHMISKMDPEGKLILDPKVPHLSYDTLLAAPGGKPGYRGGLEYPLPPEIHYDDYLSGKPSTRAGSNRPLQQGIRADLVDKPLSQKTMSLMRETPTVVATPKWVDMASEYQDIMRSLYGRR